MCAQRPLLIEHADGHRDDRDHHRGQTGRLPDAGQLMVDHQGHAEKAEPEARRRAPVDPFADEADRQSGGNERLGPHHQRRDPGLDPEVERDPHAAEPHPVQQQADHRHVHVVEPRACPRSTQSNCGNREQRRGGCEAQGEEPHRPRVRHRDRDHQVAGAPQEHEQRREQGRSIHLHLLPSRDADFTGAGSAVPVPRPRHAAAGRVAGIRESRAILRHCARDFTDEGRAAWRPIASCV